jgi:hypothetical protein
MPLTDRLNRDSVLRGLGYAKQRGAKVINLSQAAPIFREDDDHPECRRGIHLVPASKFQTGIKTFAKEWQTTVTDAGDGLVIVAMVDCPSLNAEEPGLFTWPAVTRPRPEIGLSFVDPKLLTVTAVDSWDDLIGAPGASNSRPAECTSIGDQTIQIAAPGTRWRILDTQRDVDPTQLDTGTTDCPPPVGKEPSTTCPTGCNGTSLAAPMVAGAGILVLANNPTLTPLDVKARLLDNAALDDNLGGSVEGQRLLDVAAAVGP